MSRQMNMGILGLSLIIFLLISSAGGLIVKNLLSTDSNSTLNNFKGENNENFLHDESSSKATVSPDFREAPFEFMYPANPTIQPPRASVKSTALPSKKHIVTTGTIKIAVLLICFTDVGYSSVHTPAYYINLLFNHSNPKSMASYYWENSYGQLNMTGEILGGKWYRSSHTSWYYGEDSSPGNVFPQVDNKNDHIYNLVAEGVRLADPDVNFTKFDGDGDASVDYILVVHAGDAQEATGVYNHIWSHRWSIQHNCIVDNVSVREYTMCAETSPMGTFAHELGHAVGNLPDLYDTDYSSDGIGKWGLMGAGSWNYNAGLGENPGDTPAHLCAWSKIKMGWLKPTIVTTSTSGISLPAIETTNQDSVLKIFLSNETNSVTLSEYLLVCFRSQTGFDSALPGSGILIWHIDECNKWEANDDERHKLVDLEEADASVDTPPWEQLDYYNSQAPGASVNDDNGNITDPWAPGSLFCTASIPNSDSNGGVRTYINVSVNTLNNIDIVAAYDPFPWDYTLHLMDRSAPNIHDDEPSLIEHAPGMGGFSQDFTLVWHSNRTTGDWDIYGSQTGDAGQTWDPEVQITINSSYDYSPSLIYWYPPAYWVPFIPEIVDRPIQGGIGLNTQPPLHYIVAFVSDRTGNPEIFVTISSDFLTWSRPVQITDNSAYDLDPCIIQTPKGELGLFWASNRTGNFEIYFIEEPWNTSNIIQITNNAVLDRGPSYYLSQNNTHLLAFERKAGGTSSIHLLHSTNLISWPSATIVCTDLVDDSTEPSLVEREDRTLLIAFTQASGPKEEINQVISSDWINWSPHLVMEIPKNASSPSLIEAKCGALFMGYASYNITQISHVYLIHTTQCYKFGVGIQYPQDTGDSFFNPTRVEQNSAFVFMGELQLNQSDFTAPADNISFVITDTKNTWDEGDDEIVYDGELRPGDPPPPFETELDPGRGTGRFSIPLQEFPILGILPDELPIATVLRFQIIWWYYSIKDQQVNINSSLYVELLPPEQHTQFDGNIPIQTTVDSPLTIQAPIIYGSVNYGVESITLSLYNATDETPAESVPQSKIGGISQRISKALNSINMPYSQQTIVLTDVAKAQGSWAAFLYDLWDNATTKVVATSNGIYPRKEAILFLHKLPWDTNPPRLTHIAPIEPQVDNFPVVFSERIDDDLGSFNYRIDETSITLSYRVISTHGPWIDVTYSGSDPNWIKTAPNVYQYTLTLSGLTKPVYIEYYWSVTDLADPKNYASDGNREFPYLIGIYDSTAGTTIITTILFNSTTIYNYTTVYVTTSSLTTLPSTSTTTEPAGTIGFELWLILCTLGLTVTIYQKRRNI